MKYELDWTRYYPDNGHYTIIAILTGLPLEDIKKASPSKRAWGGQTYVYVFKKLGFNSNNRFIKFNPETEYPCLMRFKRTDIKEPYWYGCVYYDNIVYMGNCRVKFSDFLNNNTNIRITSMLQVWI